MILRRDVLGTFLGFVHKHRSQLLALFFSVVITVLVVLFRERVAALRGYGYLGIFVVGILGNATVLFPVPSLAVTFAGGGVLNPLLVGLVAGLGEPIGELTGYLAGYGGSAVIEEGPRFQRVKAWMERKGFLTILFLSAIPNPLFDLAGVTAGIIRFPLHLFLLACWLGKTAKALVIAYLGARFLDLIQRWMV